MNILSAKYQPFWCVRSAQAFISWFSSPGPAVMHCFYVTRASLGKELIIYTHKILFQSNFICRNIFMYRPVHKWCNFQWPILLNNLRLAELGLNFLEKIGHIWSCCNVSMNHVQSLMNHLSYSLILSGSAFETSIHWGRVTHICVSDLTIIGHYLNQCWNIVNLKEQTSVKSQAKFIHFHSRRSSAKWRPFCLGLYVLILCDYHDCKRLMTLTE